MKHIPGHASVHWVCIIALIILAGCDSGSLTTENPMEAPEGAASPDKISGPYTHANLAVYLIQGKDRLKEKKYLTLQEGMDQKMVVVHETGNVNELAIENLSGTEDIYVQSGDIVKGGKQDRVLAFDFIVPKSSGKMPISSFCVENGRWQQRGNEAGNVFASSNDQLASKNAKLAAKGSALVETAGTVQIQTLQNQGVAVSGLPQSGQSAVWAQVAEAQGKLSKNCGGNVQSDQSASSMQLTLEDKKVQGTTAEYIDKLAGIVNEKESVIGFVFAINGKINNADTYASSALFKKLWPKLLKASAVEAVAELQADTKIVMPDAVAVQTWMTEAQKGKCVEKEVSNRVKMISRRSAKTYQFDTLDKESDIVIHQNCITSE